MEYQISSSAKIVCNFKINNTYFVYFIYLETVSLFLLNGLVP